MEVVASRPQGPEAETLRRFRQRVLDEPVVANPSFGVAPNPARDQVLLRYDFGDNATTTSAVLRDAVGRIVATIPLDGAMGQKAFDVAQLTPGTYLIQYLSATGLVGNVPLVIQQ